MRRWAPAYGVLREHVEGLVSSIAVGTIIGARLYFVLQNDFLSYVQEPWKVLAIWEGGLAFFGGLFGATAAAYFYTRRHRLAFLRVADLFAPAVPVGAAIGRISCGLAGMDYGSPTSLPWGVIYQHPNSYGPIDGVARHPTQFYEMAGDLAIATLLLRLRGTLPEGALFLTYLVLFGLLRFSLFFVRGDVPVVAWGLNNGNWTALAILLVALPALLHLRRRKHVPVQRSVRESSSQRSS